MGRVVGRGVVLCLLGAAETQQSWTLDLWAIDSMGRYDDRGSYDNSGRYDNRRSYDNDDRYYHREYDRIDEYQRHQQREREIEQWNREEFYRRSGEEYFRREDERIRQEQWRAFQPRDDRIRYNEPRVTRPVFDRLGECQSFTRALPQREFIAPRVEEQLPPQQHLRSSGSRQSSPVPSIVPDAQSVNSDCFELTPCPKISIELCEEMSRLFTAPISSAQSKAVSAEFPLTFEEPAFSLKPPKLDPYRERRAKAKGVLSDVKAKDDVLSKLQLVVMVIAPPLLELRARLGECGNSANPMKLRIERTVKASLNSGVVRIIIARSYGEILT